MEHSLQLIITQHTLYRCNGVASHFSPPIFLPNTRFYLCFGQLSKRIFLPGALQHVICDLYHIKYVSLFRTIVADTFLDKIEASMSAFFLKSSSLWLSIYFLNKLKSSNSNAIMFNVPLLKGYCLQLLSHRLLLISKLIMIIDYANCIACCLF